MKEGILKKLRDNEQIPQKKLAKIIGVSQQTVASWDMGRTEPSNDSLVKIADYFKVSVDYLLGRNREHQEHTLSKEQISLLENYNSLGADGQNLLKNLLAFLTSPHGASPGN